MSFIHVCSLARIEATVAEIGARSMVTLLQAGTPIVRPAAIALDRHLFLSLSDIVEPVEGHILPGAEHVETLLDFVYGWDRAAPLLIHCFAGVSRSTAAAFIGACALNSARDESEIARTIRTASPTATPNARIVALADDILGRNGRMNQAIAEIGRGEDCTEGVPFSLSIA
jgi:predicted protein tyrosine phosphatase